MRGMCGGGLAVARGCLALCLWQRDGMQCVSLRVKRADCMFCAELGDDDCRRLTHFHWFNSLIASGGCFSSLADFSLHVWEG